jgi:Ca2+-binding RTX toxin-like protein
LGGNDVLVGGAGHDTFVGGAGNDLMQAGGGGDTFLFNGSFGQDRITGYEAGDKLVFLGVPGAGTDHDHSEYLSQVGNDTLLKVGDSSVTLVGVGLDQVGGDGIVFA